MKTILMVETYNNKRELISVLEATHYIKLIEKLFKKTNLFLADAIRVYNSENTLDYKSYSIEQNKSLLYNRSIKSDADYVEVQNV